MKILLKFLFIACLVQSCSNSPKLGYVESDRLLIEFNETKTAAKEIEKSTAKTRNRFDTLKSEFEQLQDEFTQKLSSYSESERNVVEQRLNRKQENLNKYYNLLSSKIKEEDQKVTKRLLKKIDKVIKEYGEKNNFDLIFGASTKGNIVYAKKTKNLTNEIIQILNK